MSKASNIGRLLAVAVIVLPSGQALAQGSAAAAGVLEEIVVTARKRTEALQDVPISITAFSADAIERRGIESVYDIAKLTPNLSFNQTYGRVFDRPVIRGMSQLLGERTVSFVVDGVYIAGNITGADLDDIETVEVLKGPQAANFGRASLAGVISYRTIKPSNVFKGRTSVSVGDDGYKEISANITGPLMGETLTYKLGARYYDYDGQYTARSSDGTFPKLGAEQTKRVSGAIRWQPTDEFDATLRAFAALNSDGLYNNTISTALNCFQVPGARGGSFCGAFPTVPQNGALAVDFSDIARQGHPGVEQDSFLYSLEANWDFGPATATALVSWNRQDEDWIVDDYIINTPQSPFNTAGPSQTPGPTMTVQNPGNITRLIQIKEYQSQELRFASNNDGRLQWLAGVYFYQQDNSGFNGGPRYNVLQLGMAFPVGSTVGQLREVSQPSPPFSVENQAVFGSVSFDPTDRWHLTLEGRYAKDKLETNNTVLANSNCQPKLNAEFTSFTPRGTVRFDFTDDLNVYLSVAKGNKPGDFNISLCAANIPPAAFSNLSDLFPLAVDEESSLNYELGTKMRLLNGRMSIDAAIFFTDWTDQQVTGSSTYVTATGSPSNISLTGNAGKTEVKGLELSWRWRYDDNWDFNATYGYVDAKFTELCDSTLATLLQTPYTTTGPCPSVGVPPGPVTNFADASGFQTANAPKHTASAGVEFRAPFGADKSFFVRTDFSYQGERFAEVYNHASTGDSSRIDARLGVETDRWRVTAWARNLGNDRTPDSVVRFFDPNSGFLFTRAFQVHYPNGRQIGVTGSYKFGQY
ncbi:MAG: TonB-dependent receptor [Steroidobacteraceae bacterium]